MEDVTRILDRAGSGDAEAASLLMDLVYGRLRAIAAERMLREAPGQTLQPTALVHEAWLRLGGDDQPRWKNRAHFFGAASEAMRRILVERARHKKTLRKGGGADHLDVDQLGIATPGTDAELLSVHEFLDRFAVHHPSRAQLVKLHYFTGMSFRQAAEILDISEATAKRWWIFSKAWLLREITAAGR
ncbi:MAG: RNA polymerase subunit sigma [Verrucomicrobia bacterium]|nr:RNA polymerase subunit sigma [Verrucomicrobiota bacterium]